jgi:crotonobetainyl-CoA:carnitine CoA-transferase CaiB-like acyl-CoA transferase
MGTKLLSGLKVVEAGDSVSTAFCGKLLAALGAEVIMVEPPGGSQLRRLAPYYENIPGPERSILHTWLCSNKKSITLDLDDERGTEMMRKLLRRSHALIRTRGVLANENLQSIHRDLTVTTLSPFGSAGPYADYQANDLVLFAMSGFSYYLASPVSDPASTPPMKNPGRQVSLVAGLRAASATLWGIFAARRKGEGVSVDVSELEAFTYLLYQYTAHVANGTLPPDRKQIPGAVITIVGGLVWCLPCSDGWVMVSPREDHQFRRWGEVIGQPEWLSKPEFSTAARREENAWHIYKQSAAWTSVHKKHDVFRAAQEKRVACFPVSEMRDLPELEQLQHRGFFTEIDHRVIRGVRYPGFPAKINHAHVPDFECSPRLGQHSEEVYGALDMLSDEMDALSLMGAI